VAFFIFPALLGLNVEERNILMEKTSIENLEIASEPSRSGVILALAAVYSSWGSTYLAIKFALEELPPLFMMGIRFSFFGIGFYLFLWAKGSPHPTSRQWLWSAVIGVFLMLGGSAGVAWAEQWVSSGMAALVIATTPLWTVLFAGIWKRWPNAWEWAGLIIGLVGIVVLNFDGDLRASPLGAAALVLAAMSWAFGSALSQNIPIPKGMMAGAAQMIAGGFIVLIVSFLIGERITVMPTWRSISAVIYLGVFGSLIGFTSYVYLLGRVRPALATSYAYVNPIIAVLLGIWILGERITMIGVSAMAIIVVGVILVAFGQRGGRSS
jgi:drug/metabolite transporter (DMT)-like permease